MGIDRDFRMRSHGMKSLSNSAVRLKAGRLLKNCATTVVVMGRASKQLGMSI